ncbi:MAG: substrate-binding domain-containing protein [Spirochaetaceae bacterium]|jgi:DNA-binding LacI/PurR family transcriptional regulator|nr:substrate-binding domain-containing protein [Spirochaetaceae bacterium]
MAGIKSRVICNDLLRRITSGDLSGVLMLPAEIKLAETYACSRPTIRKALSELREAGYITGSKGSGSYVTGPAQVPRKDNTETFLGIIFPNMGPEYFFDLLCNNLARRASENGYSLVFGGYVSPKSEMLKSDIMQICDRYIAQKIKGIFFAPFGYHSKSDQINKEIIYSFSGAGIPVVLLDSNIERYPLPNNFDLVSLNHIQAGYVITEHLIKRNAKRLFFLAPPNSHHSVRMRLVGCRAAMTDGGIMPGEDTFVEMERDDIGALSRFIDEKKPEAILCSNDMTAMSIMQSLEKLGRGIPGDIMIAGFDNLSKVMLFSRSITSIEQPIDDISRAALALMVERMAAQDKPVSHVSFSGTLVVGESTAAPLEAGIINGE